MTSERRRLAVSVLLAVASVSMLAWRVESGFERVRIPVAHPATPIPAEHLELALPDTSALAGEPVALIARVSAPTEPVTLRLSMGTSLVAAVMLEPDRLTRIDASFPPQALAAGALRIVGSSPGWEIRSLELSNAHGFSRGLLAFVIVPQERQTRSFLPGWLLLVLLPLLVALRPRLDWPAGRTGRAAYRTGVALVLLLFAATLLAPAATSYTVLLSPTTVLLCAAVLYAETVGLVARRIWRAVWPNAARQSRAGVLVRRSVPHAVIVALFIASIAQFYDSGTGWTRLILFPEGFQATAVEALRDLPIAVIPGGYDGYLYAQLAVDPLLRDDATAVAVYPLGYRGRRILFSWVAYAAGGGDPWRILQAYALLNVVCWLILAALLLRWLPPTSIQMTAAWAACLLSHGMLSSVRLSLLDGPSMLLLALAVLAVDAQRHRLGALMLGISGLARETNLLGGTMLAPSRLCARDHSRLAVLALLVVTPLLIWLLYLWSMGFTSGPAGERNFAPPLVGLFDRVHAAVAALREDGWASIARFDVLSLIGLSLQGAVLVWWRDWHNAWWRLAIPYVVLMLVLGEAVWEGSPIATTRVVLPLTFAFNVLLPGKRHFWLLWAFGNLNVIHGVETIAMPGLSGRF